MRTLRRPLFRGGSTGTGITSGLAPRQGYKGTENPADQRVMSDWLRTATLGDVKKFASENRYQPRGTNVYDFLTEFGLNIASTPPQGNIFQTAAAAAKEPHQRFLAKKGEAEASQYVSEADMFKTLIKAGATAQGDTGLAGKTEQWKMEQIPGLVNSIAEIEAIPEKDRTSDQRNQLKSDRIKLGRLETDDPFVTWFLQEPKAGLGLFKKIKTDLIQQDQKSDEPKYDQELGEDDPQLIIDAFIEFRKQVKAMGKAEGGRIGYQNAGPVLGQGFNIDPTRGPLQGMDVGTAAKGIPQDEMPEELGDISYEELRARLPQEVSDEIVRLLANSAEALEDFATIQTEQDISNFNKKYGVNLVLPAEA